MFAREVACAIRQALGVGYHKEERYDDAKMHVSRGKYVADRLDAPYCIERAKTLSIGLFGATGDAIDALKLLQEPNENEAAQGVVIQAYFARARAFFASQLGNLDDAVNTLERHLTVVRESNPDTSELREGSELATASELQRINLFWGTGEHDKPLILTGNPAEIEGQLSTSLQKLLEALATAPFGHSLKKRRELFERALEPWSEPRQPWKFMWARSIGCWVQSFVHLQLGHPELAKNFAQGIEYPTDQSLDLRLLEAGANLEICLDINFRDTSDDVRRWLQKLQDVFVHARNEPMASPEGLAYLLMFWHPAAAAFAALVPGGIRELSGAVAAVLEVGARNRAYDIQLPAVLATEWGLRALGYDIHASVKFDQADIGGGRTRRDQLVIKRRDFTYYRPVVSSVSIIYGLARLGELERAKGIYTQYGVVPKARSDSQYVMLPLLANIDKCVEALLYWDMPIDNFAEEIRSGNPSLGSLANMTSKTKQASRPGKLDA